MKSIVVPWIQGLNFFNISVPQLFFKVGYTDIFFTSIIEGIEIKY
jgi:hypothetical protein